MAKMQIVKNKTGIQKQFLVTNKSKIISIIYLKIAFQKGLYKKQMLLVSICFHLLKESQLRCQSDKSVTGTHLI
ncbi:MAG: hypothetical protein QM697_17085 [Lachnospiraceae bacterium]